MSSSSSWGSILFFVMVITCLVKMGDNRLSLFFQPLLLMLIHRQKLFFFDITSWMVEMLNGLMSNSGYIFMRGLLLLLDLLFGLGHRFDLSLNDTLEQGLSQSLQWTLCMPLRFDDFSRYAMSWQQRYQIVLD